MTKEKLRDVLIAYEIWRAKELGVFEDRSFVQEEHDIIRFLSTLPAETGEQKLLSTPSQEKVAVEFAEWIVANNYVKSGTRYTAVSWIPENGEQKTTSELYHIFLSHQQTLKK